MYAYTYTIDPTKVHARTSHKILIRSGLGAELVKRFIFQALAAPACVRAHMGG